MSAEINDSFRCRERETASKEARLSEGCLGPRLEHVPGPIQSTVQRLTVSTTRSQDAEALFQTSAEIIDGEHIESGSRQLQCKRKPIQTVDNLTNIRTNAEATRSTITDTDYAASTTELAKAQIIAQAGTAMLAQANQLPQTVLALLQ